MQSVLSLALSAFYLVLGSSLAHAHIGMHHAAGFAAGAVHPLSGIDHVAVMLAVGLWAALKGGRAVWAWPAVFVGVMLLGGALGMAQVPLPFVEPAILASVVALGLLVALAADLPLSLGAAVIAVFALAHGYAHGMEAPGGESGATYLAGFALATASLHAVGIGFAFAMTRLDWRPGIRAAGLACVLVGVGLAAGLL
jgi:urease accessory protein